MKVPTLDKFVNIIDAKNFTIFIDFVSLWTVLCM